MENKPWTARLRAGAIIAVKNTEKHNFTFIISIGNCNFYFSANY